MRDTRWFSVSIFLFYASPQCLCTIFSLFSPFFSNRATRCGVSQRSQFRRKTNFIDRCIRNPGKNFSHCLKPRSPRVRRREKDREQWRYIIPRFYQRNVSITLVRKSNFIFFDSHFFEHRSIFVSSKKIVQAGKGKERKEREVHRNEEDADLSYAWPHLRLVRGYILPPESFPPAARKLVARFHPRFLPLHPNQPWPTSFSR